MPKYNDFELDVQNTEVSNSTCGVSCGPKCISWCTEESCHESIRYCKE